MYNDEFLPKIWMGRIQKYWDYIKPVDLPKSSSKFSDIFESTEVKNAVVDMERSLRTEDSVIKEFVPDDLSIAGYVGTYNVKAEPGVKTVLSPAKVYTDNILVVHYNDGNWEKVEDVSIEDGYVWGTLDSFSPIAMFTLFKDISIVSEIPNYVSGSWLVANGTPVAVDVDEESKVIATSKVSGKKIDITECVGVIGGTCDGSDVASTLVSINNIDNPKFTVIAGSVFANTDDEIGSANVGTVKVSVSNSNILNVAGSSGKVITDKFIQNLSSSTLNFIGSGESYVKNLKKDVNKQKPTAGSKMAIKEVVTNITDCNIYLCYFGGNSGYTYTGKVTATVTGGKIDYILACPSNGRLENIDITVDNVKGKIFQTTNRGVVAKAVAKISNSEIDKLFITGDATDKSVTGTVESVKIDINKGKYNIYPGTDAGKPIESAEMVESVKISRSAEFEEFGVKKILGSKFVIK